MFQKAHSKNEIEAMEKMHFNFTATCEDLSIPTDFRSSGCNALCGIQDTNLAASCRHIFGPSFRKMKPANVLTHALGFRKTPIFVAWIPQNQC